MFTVSQYDTSSYLFTRRPSFRWIRRPSPTASSSKESHRHQRHDSRVGQAYSPLSTTVTSAKYTAQGELLSSVGTVIAIQSGPLTDQFFLSFDQLGPRPMSRPIRFRFRLRRSTWRRLRRSVYARSRRSIRPSRRSRAYRPPTLRCPRPTPPCSSSCRPTDAGEFLSANQVGVAQLAIQYCNVASPATRRSCSRRDLQRLAVRSERNRGRSEFGHERPRGASARQRIDDPAGSNHRDRRTQQHDRQALHFVALHDAGAVQAVTARPAPPPSAAPTC